MENKRLIDRKTALGEDEEMLHCPKCFMRRKHARRVSGGMEIFTCRSCGNVQSYQLREVEEVES